MTSKAEVRANKAFKRVAPVMVPLLELFSTVDEVFNEDGAFAEENIHKSLGRIYREWLQCRSNLDPDFDQKRYRQSQRQHASAARTYSTGTTTTVDKSQKKKKRPEKKYAT